MSINKKITEEKVEEDMKKRLYDEVDDIWGFVLKASEIYKEEFRKTAKIAQAPRIDDIIEQTILGDEYLAPDEEAEEAEAEKEEDSAQKAKNGKKDKSKKKK